MLQSSAVKCHISLGIISEACIVKKKNRDFVKGVRRNYMNSHFNKFRTVSAVPALDITVAVDQFFICTQDPDLFCSPIQALVMS